MRLLYFCKNKNTKFEKNKDFGKLENKINYSSSFFYNKMLVT